MAIIKINLKMIINQKNSTILKNIKLLTKCEYKKWQTTDEMTTFSILNLVEALKSTTKIIPAKMSLHSKT